MFLEVKMIEQNLCSNNKEKKNSTYFSCNVDRKA